MFTVEDILIRYYRMKGYAALWLPGSDHAGFETQVVFEKHLNADGKSRFDYDRDTLFQMIYDFVKQNKGTMESQLRRLGFSLDWSREKFTLDPDVVSEVYATFKSLFDDGLVYRDSKLVNYCTKHGTGFSDLEINYVEKQSPLYYIKYGPLTLATTRPETKFGDTAVAVHPDDTRYQKYINQEIEIETVLGKSTIKVIGDESVDPQFGTGVVKITPAHDHNDYEVSKRHNLPLIQVIGYNGRMMAKAGKYEGLTVNEARKTVVEDMITLGLIEKIDEQYNNRVGTCYKCGITLEPLPLEQWYIKVAPLAKAAIQAVKKNDIKIYPDNFSKIYFHWMENIRDWNISRQIVWGIRIPAWVCEDCLKWTVTTGQTPDSCSHCQSTKLQQDQDTFDTWFSSGQWPAATLKNTSPTDFDKFYPTQVMETGRDILFFWVARMIMLGIYRTNQVPFQQVLLHGMVLDPLGKKMSKSKNNVVSPIEIADQYGADAARMALVFGTATGHDQSLSYSKLDAMRKFTNKLWNIGRFIIDFKPEDYTPSPNSPADMSGMIKQFKHADDQKILQDLNQTIKQVSSAIESYRFHDGAESIYEFIWHNFADKYIESTKERRQEAQPVLEYVLRVSLELLHPYMPFITEEIWSRLPKSSQDMKKASSIMITHWPIAQ
jgi:valyl-tRNA synthetase